MNGCLECLPCFIRQPLDAARMATDDVAVQEAIMREVFSVLLEADWKRSPPAVSAGIHRVVKRHTSVVDPYKAIKESSTRTALELRAKCADQVTRSDNPFETAVRLAIAGNIIDFGAKRHVTDEDIRGTVRESLTAPIFGVGADVLKATLDTASTVLYLGDNAGETVFDGLLIEQISPDKVTYVVKGGACINDATYEDARQAGLTDIVEVTDNGSDAPGTILRTCSDQFKRRFAQADVVIAKGQGNYESLSDVDRSVVFLLKVKCPPIARDIGCEVGDLVALVKGLHDIAGKPVEELKGAVSG